MSGKQRAVGGHARFGYVFEPCHGSLLGCP